jgi:methylmalonyl-CoA mutase C-terminal domain/subunit
VVNIIRNIYIATYYRGIWIGKNQKKHTRGNMTDKKIRVLIAKPGLDGHDRGAKVVARALRDAGMEVIYIGLKQTPEQIVETAIQEDVDVIGLSCLSGAHTYLFPKVMELLKKNNIDDILVTCGGIIPDDDVDMLKEAGIRGIFGPGCSTEDIVEYIKKNVKR